MNSKLLKLFGLVFFSVTYLTATPSIASPQSDEARKILLVRHAEKIVGGSKDPSLTAKGFQRARNLAEMLKKHQITAIYSTDYKRTKQTAAPAARLLDLSVALYDPRKLKEFATQIKQSSGNVLIVGHSNTTPQLVNLLGGDSHGEIDESEYTRLYILSIDKDDVRTELVKTTAEK
jgi:broad specificity phosphatase PhoE